MSYFRVVFMSLLKEEWSDRLLINTMILYGHRGKNSKEFTDATDACVSVQRNIPTDLRLNSFSLKTVHAVLKIKATALPLPSKHSTTEQQPQSSASFLTALLRILGINIKVILSISNKTMQEARKSNR